MDFLSVDIGEKCVSGGINGNTDATRQRSTDSLIVAIKSINKLRISRIRTKTLE